jgi:hypothetical protein
MSFGTVQAEKMTTESGYSLGAGNASSFKNRLINGGMTIAQRNNGDAVTGTTFYAVDRFFTEKDGAGVLTCSRSTDAPEGFAYSLKTEVTTVDSSIGSTDYYQIGQRIEADNVSDFGLGLSWCKPFMVSFWAKASQTGTYSVQLANSTGSRCYPSTITINSANTWEYKTIPVPATTSGTFNNRGNTIGLGIRIGFAYGSNFNGATANSWGNFSSFSNSFATPSNSMLATSGATFFITGAQIELGTVATSFDFRDYGRELIMCQRYFETVYPTGIVPGSSSYLYVEYSTCTATNATGYLEGTFKYTVVKRASPTITTWDVAGNIGKCAYYVSGSNQDNKQITANNTSNKHISWYSDNVSTKGGVVFGWSASAEL